jgi:protein TonB
MPGAAEEPEVEGAPAPTAAPAVPAPIGPPLLPREAGKASRDRWVVKPPLPLPKPVDRLAAISAVETAAGPATAIANAKDGEDPSEISAAGGVELDRGNVISSLRAPAGEGDGTSGTALDPPGYALGSDANPLPRYPLAARFDGAEGRVMLRVRVDARGQVETVDVTTSSGHAILDRAAIDTVRRWRFAPARRDGLPVPAEINVPIQFRLRG